MATRACLSLVVLAGLTGCGAHGWLRGPDDTPDSGGADAAAPIDGGNGPDSGMDAETDAGRDAGIDAGPSSDIGDPCSDISACMSASELVGADLPACIMEGTWNNGSAWTDGYCTDACAAPPAPEDGAPLLQLDCPPDSLCVPLDDAGMCLRSCETDADCRTEGDYFCRHDFGGFGGPVLTTNGVCAAWHCRTRGCPGSARCEC